MPIEQSKIIARFKDKFKTVAIPKTRLDDIAAKLSQALPDEADDEAIDAQLDFVNSITPFIDIQKWEDKLVNDRKKAETAASAQRNQGNQQQAQDDPAPAAQPQQVAQQTDDPPAWAKAFLQKQEELSLEIQTMKTQEQQKTVRQQAEALMEGVNPILKKFAMSTVPANADDLPDWAANVKADNEALLKEQREQNMKDPGGNGKPPSGNAGPVSINKEELRAMAKEALRQ